MRATRLTVLAVAVVLHSRLATAQDEPIPDPKQKDKTASEDEAAIAEAEAEENPARPPAKGKGVIWGVVRSGATNETLIEAQVAVTEGPAKKKVLTDVEGRFRLELPPGNYDLRSFYELHKAKRVQNVPVVEGKVVQIDILLDADQKAEEVVEAVVADIERGSTATQLEIRKKSAVSADSIGAADIARTPDRNAADTAKRIVGTTVVDGKFVFVRGLGERYTNAMLDDAPVPSPEPDRVAVPLDMFPAMMISDITVLKTFAPDMPGDFAGGSVRIHTRDLPSKFKVAATLGIGANTESTFANRWSYAGGGLDWLGFNDGTRSLPKGIPNEKLPDQIPDPKDPPFGMMDNPAVKEAGKKFVSPFNTNRTANLPNFNFSGAIGDSIPLGKLGRIGVLGYQAALAYTRRFQNRTNEKLRVFNADAFTVDPARTPETDVTGDTGYDIVSWSALGKASFSRGKDHTISALGMFSVNANTEARKISGSVAKSVFNEETRLRFQSRQLAFAQLNGEHHLPKAGTKLDYFGSISRATLDDPDMRTLLYSRDLATPNVPPRWGDNLRGAEHFYGYQIESGYAAGANLTQDIVKSETTPASFKFGGMVNVKRRSFAVRRLNFRPGANPDPNAYAGPPEGFLGKPESIDSGVIRYEDNTQPTDQYRATADVFALYSMADFSLGERFRMIVGPRLEVGSQSINSFDLFMRQSPKAAKLDRADVLPAAHLIFKATQNANVRFSLTKTLARPQLRELAPFVFTEFNGARDSYGNPDLDRTQITNLDLRFEMFPAASEVLAVTTFFKHFDKPIERTIIQTNIGTDSFSNAPGGTNIGLELEGRKNLRFLHKALDEFSVLGNLTFVKSQVTLTQAQSFNLTSIERPMAGQSPYVFNAAVDWTHEKTRTRIRLLYNVFGPRLFAVGQKPIPDIYEQPRHTFDATATQGFGEHIDVKLSAENIFNAPYVFSHSLKGGDLVTNEYRMGCNFWLSLTYTN